MNVTRNDRGVYRCYSQNNVGMAAFYDAFVKIRFPPSAKPLRVGGYYGQAPDRNYEVMFECVTTGYPDPDVDWYQDGVKDPLKDSTRYEIEKLVSQGSAYLQFDDRIMTLRIRNVMSQDFGNYTCSATNKYGSSNTSIEFFCAFLQYLMYSYILDVQYMYLYCISPDLSALVITYAIRLLAYLQVQLHL